LVFISARLFVAPSHCLLSRGAQIHEESKDTVASGYLSSRRRYSGTRHRAVLNFARLVKPCWHASQSLSGTAKLRSFPHSRAGDAVDLAIATPSHPAYGALCSKPHRKP